MSPNRLSPDYLKLCVSAKNEWIQRVCVYVCVYKMAEWKRSDIQVYWYISRLWMDDVLKWTD